MTATAKIQPLLTKVDALEGGMKENEGMIAGLKETVESLRKENFRLKSEKSEKSGVLEGIQGKLNQQSGAMQRMQEQYQVCDLLNEEVLRIETFC